MDYRRWTIDQDLTKDNEIWPSPKFRLWTMGHWPRFKQWKTSDRLLTQYLDNMLWTMDYDYWPRLKQWIAQRMDYWLRFDFDGVPPRCLRTWSSALVFELDCSLSSPAPHQAKKWSWLIVPWLKRCAFVHFLRIYWHLVVGVHHRANFWLDVLQIW